MELALEAWVHSSTESQIRELLRTLTRRGRGRLATHGHIALHRAIVSGNSGAARALLEQPELQVNLPLAGTQGGGTVLHIAVELGDERIAQLILDRVDLDPGLGNRRGETPLHLAASNSPAILNVLLQDPRVDITALTFLKETALHIACKVAGKAQATLEIVRKLLELAETNARISLTGYIEMRDMSGRTCLHYAAESGLGETICELLNRFEPRERQHFVLARDNERHIALHLAAQKENLGAVQLLLPFGDHTFPSTTVHHAVRSGRRDIVHACLTSKCCRLPENSILEEVTRYYLELFDIATNHSVAICLQESLCEFLSLHPVAHKTECPKSLLIYALKVDDAHGLIGHVLKWHPAMANAPMDADTQQTPLHVATLQQNQSAIQALCREGAPWFLNGIERDVYDNTALDYAFESANESIQRVLLERSDVRRHHARLRRTRGMYVAAANAILVVSALIASLCFVRCLSRQEAAEKKKADAGEPLELKIVYTVVSTRMAFLLATMATILALFAALPFRIGLLSVQTVDDSMVRSIFRTKVLIFTSSYLLTWSLFSVLFGFVCSVWLAPLILDYKCEWVCSVVVGLFIVVSLLVVAANGARLWSKLRKRTTPGRNTWSRARVSPLDTV